MRLYFTTIGPGNVPGTPTVAFAPDWDDTTNVGRAMLSATPTNTANSGHGRPHSDAVHNRLHRQFVYKMSGPGTLQGYARAFLRVYTRNGVGINEAAQDMISQMVIRVVSADGQTVRGTALASYNPSSSAGQTKWDAYTSTNRRFPSIGRWDNPAYGALLTPVDYQDGDYLVVEIGLRNFTIGTSTGGNTHYNDTATSDLPTNETETANLRSWIDILPPGIADRQILGANRSLHGNQPVNMESDPVNTATGNYVSEATDLALPGRGLPFAFARTYNSQSPDLTPADAAPNLVRFPSSGTASYTASREYSSSYAAHDAADGITGNSSATGMSWAVSGWQSGDWWQVTWSAPQALDRIELCDRRTGSWYFGSAGRVTFSDGSTLNWSDLPNDCGSSGANTLRLTFPRKTNITWFRVIADAGGLSNAGLAEVEAFDDYGSAGSIPTASGLGPGWTHSYAARLELDAGRVWFIAEDGAQVVFVPAGSGAYSAPAGVQSTLADLPGGGYELTRRDRLRYQFDAAGQLSALLDRNGNELAFAYSAGKLSAITDTVGRSLTLVYHPSGRLASLSGPQGLSVTYAYDATNRLSSVTDVRGQTTTYTYDGGGRLKEIFDANDRRVVLNEYGADGRVTAQTDARGERGTFAWDAATGTSTYTDARGGTWIDVYDANRLVSQTNPLGRTTTYTYDAESNLLSLSDPRGHTTSYAYDGAGNLLERAAPTSLGYAPETWTYNAANDPLTSTDRRGNSTSYAYDAAGNLIEISAPLDAVTSFGRDPAGSGLLVSTTDPRGKTTSFGYDAQANQTSVTTPLGNLTTMTHDAAGRLLTLVEPRGNASGADPADYTTSFSYDAAGNLLTSTDPLGNVTTQTYDDVGNLTSVTDANDHTTSYAYGPANHLTSVTDAAGELTAYAYDEVGNLVSRTDANDHVTTYAYDLAGQLTASSDPLGNDWALTYDPAGNIATRTDAMAATTTYSYDALNRLTQIAYATSATPTVSFGYDAVGNQTSMTDGAGTETTSYDALSRPTQVSRGTDTFSYAYDPAGNLTSRTYPGQAAQAFSYDDDGRLAGANGASYAYDPAANLLSAATPDGITAALSHDRAGRLAEVAHLSAGGTLSRFTYGLDPVGNRTAMTTREGTVTYRYDALDRLTEACWSSTTCPGGAPAAPLACLACVGPPLPRPAASLSPPAGETYRTYTYDPVGNRLAEASDAGTTTYAYDAADRLTSLTPPGGSPVSYAFDANGNQTAAGASTFAWDHADRLTSATVGGVTESYTYAGDGTRLSATTGGATTQFAWDRAFGLPQLALEREGGGTLLRSYRYGLDLLSQTSGASATWYHHDGLGSVTDLTDPAGASLAWSEYYPYGQLRQGGSASGAPAVQPFAFTGEQLDATTGLYHLRARQYDPAMGRFLSTDPVAAPISDSYVASYAYVRNMPTRYVDPSGRCLGPLIFLAPACIGAAVGLFGYVTANTTANVVDNVQSDRPWHDDLTRGYTVQDTLISAIAGPLGGPIAGVRTFGARLMAGAGLGAAATVVSQELGGGECPNAARIGVAGGALTAAFARSSLPRSFLLGALVSAAQGVASAVVGCGRK